jgi:hypothetical protein
MTTVYCVISDYRIEWDNISTDLIGVFSILEKVKEYETVL